MLYQVVEEYWLEFQAELTHHGKNLPAYVIKEYTESDLQEMRDIIHEAETVLNDREWLNNDGIAIQAATEGVV